MPQRLVDFGRHADLKFVPAVKWNEANATPVTDIETMDGLLADHGGVSASDALMSSKVFNALVKNAEFKERFVTPKGDNAPSPFQPQFNKTEGMQYRGELDGKRFWTFDETHKLSGTEKTLHRCNRLLLDCRPLRHSSPVYDSAFRSQRHSDGVFLTTKLCSLTHRRLS